MLVAFHSTLLPIAHAHHAEVAQATMLSKQKPYLSASCLDIHLSFLLSITYLILTTYLFGLKIYSLLFGHQVGKSFSLELASPVQAAFVSYKAAAFVSSAVILIGQS